LCQKSLFIRKISKLDDELKNLTDRKNFLSKRFDFIKTNMIEKSVILLVIFNSQLINWPFREWEAKKKIGGFMISYFCSEENSTRLKLISLNF